MVKAWKEQVVIPTYEVGKPKRIRCFWKIAFIREVVVSFIPYPCYRTYFR